MKLKNKFLSLIGTIGLIFGSVAGNQTTCSAEGDPIKVVFLGDAGVGKTCILSRLVQCDFDTDAYQPTIGASYCRLKINDKVFDLYDTAGQEKYSILTPFYLRGAKIVIFVFDLTKIEEEKDQVKANLKNWISQKKDNAPENAHCILVGNKQDLLSNQNISTTIQEITNECGISQFFDTSALTCYNIDLLKDALYNICKQDDKNNENFYYVNLEENSPSSSEPQKNSCCNQ